MLACAAAISKDEHFIWCLASGCGSGQFHISGNDQPIVTCNECGNRICFRHNVTWHQGWTCDEYEVLMKDSSAKSKFEKDNEEWKAQQIELQQREFRGSNYRRLSFENRAQKQRRDQRVRRESEHEHADLVRKRAAQRKKEEELNNKCIMKTTKSCPGCSWPIEKNGGW